MLPSAPLSPLSTPLFALAARIAPALLCAPAALAQVDDFDHAATAAMVLERAGLGEVQPEDFTLPVLLEADYVHAPLGLFEIHVRRASAEESSDLSDVIDVMGSLLEAQKVFLGWVAPASEFDLDETEADADLLIEFLDGLRADRVSGRLGDNPDFWDAAAAGEKELAALERLGAQLRFGEALGLSREAPRTEHVVLTPGRRDFFELACIAGWMVPETTGTFWSPEVLEWNNLSINETQVLCMVNPGNTPSNLDTSRALDEKYADGMRQQMVQLAGNNLFNNFFGENIPPSLAQALAVNLVIDVFGSCSTRVDGDLRERRAAAREVFVAGGNPNGGTLPPNLADNRWRLAQGQDRFLTGLTEAQSAGGKAARGKNGKTRHFELEGEDQDKRVVSGPFIGPNNGSDAREPLPQSFYWEEIEFLRSYRIAFVHWLRTAAAGRGDKSPERFAHFLKALALDEERRGLLEITPEIYGMPLSSEELEGKTDLEGGFLEWLRKQ